MSDHIRTETRNGVLTIAIERPEKKNAIGAEMYGAMARALGRADEDAEIGCVLFKGLPGLFSAGSDIAEFMAVAEGGPRTGEVDDFLRAIATSTKPILAAVDGLAIGVGTTILLHFDAVYASPNALFRTPFCDLGLVPEAGSSLLAPRIMGPREAFALLVAGETFDAERAHRAGLVSRVVASGELETQAQNAAEALAAKPREAVRLARDLVRGPRDEILSRIAAETELFFERLHSEEARAAFSRFLARAKD